MYRLLVHFKYLSDDGPDDTRKVLLNQTSLVTSSDSKIKEALIHGEPMLEETNPETV